MGKQIDNEGAFDSTVRNRLNETLVNAVQSTRVRIPAATINGAGGMVVGAVPGHKIRVVDLTMIAIGGGAATATSVDIIATQAGAEARLMVAAVAALTQSAVVKPNSANVSVLANGASFIANDENTSIMVAKQAGGGNLGTATHIDVVCEYVVEKV